MRSTSAGRLALVADIGEIDVGGAKQLLCGQIGGCAGARIAIVELAGFFARVIDEVGERLHRYRWIDEGDTLVPDGNADAFEVLHRIPTGVLVKARIDQHGRPRHQPCVAVRIASRDQRGADITVCSRS
jgi:hypothetical protein